MWPMGLGVGGLVQMKTTCKGEEDRYQCQIKPSTQVRDYSQFPVYTVVACKEKRPETQ
jgi:hypothetical protein